MYIGLNKTAFLWVATNMGYHDVVATNFASTASGLLSTSEWTVYNDSRTCSPNPWYKIKLTLTSCRRDEFTCADANCIPMESRSALKYLHEVWLFVSLVGVPRKACSI